MNNRHIVFVCTGNICRSPIAEYLLRDRFGDDMTWTVSSAGVMAGLGSPASSLGVHVMDEVGIDMKKHRSMPLTDELIDLVSVIVVMTDAHAQQVREQFPAAKEKVFLMTSFDEESGPRDVADPIGTTIDIYRSVRDQCGRAMPGLMAFLRELG